MNLLTFTWITVFICLLENPASARKNRLRGTRWWTLANDFMPQSYLETNELQPVSNDIYPIEDMNPSLQPLTKKQRKLVAKNPGSISAVALGAQIAIKECQYQFQNRRWNCPIKDTAHGGSIFGKILKIGCRETAFIYAITAAGVAHSMARACSEGRIHTCSCDFKLDQPAGNDWKWGGCSDNVQFGYKFSRQLIDSIEKGQDLRYMVNKQNNEAGRRHVVSETTQQCKCHGMSGSCTMKTCWMRLPPFRNIGDQLKAKFDGASKVFAGNSWATDNRAGSNRSGRSSNQNAIKPRESENKVRNNANKFNFIPVDASHKKPTRKDMVYFEDSPNFCMLDSKYQFEGTTGRECNASSMGIDGCELMCCGRGYRTEHYTAQERCSCVFKWCCEVTCQVCSFNKKRHICN